MTNTKYRGETVRGRQTVEATLEECADTLAFLANKAPNVITDRVAPDRWHVYETQADLDAGSWFAVITSEGDPMVTPEAAS